MMRRAALALGLALVASPAAAQQLPEKPTSTMVAHVFCHAAMSGDRTVLSTLYTDDFRAAVEAAGDRPVRLLGIEAPAASCMPVGNSGTAEQPETIVAFRYGAAAVTASVNVVMVFVNGALRIDDVRFADGSTLRDDLAAQ
jgi:hypothetical protein